MIEAATAQPGPIQIMEDKCDFVLQQDKKAKLEAAILEAQRAIKGVGKGSYNEYSKFSYASSDQILAASREALHGAGVSFRMSGFNIEDRAGLKWVVCQFALTHVESMETMRAAYGWPLIQSGDKPKLLDKVLGGALTTATRYYLRGLLSIPQVDNGEDMAGRHDPSDNDGASDSPRGQFRPASREQMGLINALIQETNANPAALEAEFGPGDDLAFETANKVIDHLKALKRKLTNGK